MEPLNYPELNLVSD